MDRIFNKKFLNHDIPAVIQQYAFTGCPVPACPARFLIITFDVFRHLIVNDVADIALIDAHAKGIGRNDNRDFIKGKLLLYLFTRPIGHAGMIPAYGISACFYFLVQTIHFFPRSRINDATVPFIAGKIG